MVAMVTDTVAITEQHLAELRMAGIGMDESIHQGQERTMTKWWVASMGDQ